MTGRRPTRRRAGHTVVLAALVVGVAALGATSSSAQVADDTTTTKVNTTTTQEETTTTPVKPTPTTEEETVSTKLKDTTTTKVNGTTTTKVNADTSTTKVLGEVGGTGVPALVEPVLPACKGNRVKNPSFESVTGGPGWYVLDATTTNVPSWTRGSDPALTDWVKLEGEVVFGVHPAYHGSKYAVLHGYAHSGKGRPLLIGELSSPTVAGSDYVVSARAVLSLAYQPSYGPAKVEIRLMRSSTGAQSAPVNATFTEIDDWLLIGAVVSASDAYDRVVLRSPVQGGISFIDAVRVCPVTDGKPWWQSKPLLALAVGLPVLVAGGVLVRRRRSGTSSSIFDRWGQMRAR